MLLIVSDGGLRTRELAMTLDACGADYVFHFSSVSKAGEFGSGNVIVGKPSYRSLTRIIRQNRIDAVVDMIEAPNSKASLAVFGAAEDCGLPLFKLIYPTLRAAERFASGARYSVDYSYKSIAAWINNMLGSTLFLTKPYNARAVADLVFDQSTLYAPIKAASEFDVELALEYGIPLTNIKEVDEYESFGGLLELLRDTGARLIVTDDMLNAENKFKAAAECGADIVFTQNSGYDYDYIFDDCVSLVNGLDRLGVLFDDEEDVPDEVSDEENIDESTDENTNESEDDSENEIHTEAESESKVEDNIE